MILPVNEVVKMISEKTKMYIAYLVSILFIVKKFKIVSSNEITDIKNIVTNDNIKKLSFAIKFWNETLLSISLEIFGENTVLIEDLIRRGALKISWIILNCPFNSNNPRCPVIMCIILDFKLSNKVDIEKGSIFLKVLIFNFKINFDLKL